MKQNYFSCHTLFIIFSLYLTVTPFSNSKCSTAYIWACPAKYKLFSI